MLKFICPFCNEGEHVDTRPVGTFSDVSDDDWQESNINYICPNCQSVFEVNLRVSLKTGEPLFINQTPKPQKEGIVWYAMASINKFGIKASAVCRDEVLTRMIGLSHNRKHIERLHLLKITSEGYFNEEGKKLAEDFCDKQKINYLEIRWLLF